MCARLWRGSACPKESARAFVCAGRCVESAIEFATRDGGSPGAENMMPDRRIGFERFVSFRPVLACSAVLGFLEAVFGQTQ
eukprot:5625545-Lingulodinium_polyedra.AAC.1